MKEKNSWIVWLIALVAVIALVVAIVALGKISATGEAINWNKPKSNLVNANSCDADNICEANELRLGNTPHLTYLESVDGRFIISPFSEKTLLEGQLQITSLKNNNNSTCVPSYACLSCGGVLYRSETPCN